MTLTQLEYFCAVCRYHSITRAAEALFVSQPTISTSIRDLEKEFNLRLFTHGRNRITLTNDGEAFYQKAEHILKQTHELYADFAGMQESRHPLRIGIPPMISTVFSHGLPICLNSNTIFRSNCLNTVQFEPVLYSTRSRSTLQLSTWIFIIWINITTM